LRVSRKPPYPSSRPDGIPTPRPCQEPAPNLSCTAHSPLRSRRLPPRPAVPLLSPPVSGDVGGGRGRGVPRVPRRGVADAREAAPGGARVPLGRGRVLGQHTRRIRGECFPVVDDGFLVLGRLGGHRFSGNRWIVGFVF
jgi:hypothetical protein